MTAAVLLTEQCRSLWTAREHEADGLFRLRRDAAAEEHRAKLLIPIHKIAQREQEIRVRMRNSKVAMNHAIGQLAIEAEPFVARREHFDMNLADGESQEARQIWETELCTRRENVVARYLL